MVSDDDVRAGGLRASLAVAAVGGALAVATLHAPGPGAHAVDVPSHAPAAQVEVARPGKPNVVLITADDMMSSDLAVMPHTRRLLARRGTTFTQAIAPTPICVPSRVSTLTGQYAHNHQAVTIEGPRGGFKAFSGGRDANTLPVWLRRGGYSTLFVGRYLNGYGDSPRSARYVPDGWDRWRATLGGSTYAFHGTRFTIDGRQSVRPRGYSTDIIAGYTRDLLDGQHRGSPRKPFFLWANYVAPHQGGGRESDDPPRRMNVRTTAPAARHRDRFQHVNLPRVAEMWKHTRSRWSGPRKPRRYRAAVREMHQQRLESLLAVDQAVAGTVRTLRRNGDLANTVILFTSDNGFLTGHHSRIGKLLPWDSSLRVPLIARGPGIQAGKRVSTPFTTVDLAVSIAGVARVRPGRKVDGMDILRLSREHPHARRIIPIVGYPTDNGTRPMYTGIRYGPWTYLRAAGGEELYDRRTDPGELVNLAPKKRHRDLLVEFRSLNRRTQDCSGARCPQQLYQGP